MLVLSGLEMLMYYWCMFYQLVGLRMVDISMEFEFELDNILLLVEFFFYFKLIMQCLLS